jgi:hypothetical protein
MENTLRIIKKSPNVFWHIHNEVEQLKFAISNFDISIDGNIFKIVEIDGAERYRYQVPFISIIDETGTSAVENFTTPEAFYNRLINLGYTAFKITTAPFLGSVVPTSPVPAVSGDFFVIATEAGTYTNFGGVVVGINKRAEISRVGGVFSISQTNLDISSKLNASDVINSLISTETTKPLSAAQGKFLNEKNIKIETWTAKPFLSGDQTNYNGIDWVANTNTLSTDIPGISSKWVDRLIRYSQVAFCLYEIYIDRNGYALSYSAISNNAVSNETYINQYRDIQVTIDSNGYALEGWDWYMRPLVFTKIPKIEPLPNKTKDTFSEPINVVKGNFHYGFPGIAVGLTGILHSVYRKGLYHTGIDGSLMYSYSKDGGATWSPEVVFMQGGTLVTGAYQDFRDTKCLRMSNGKFIVNGFIGFATPNAGTPPNHVDYDMDRYECYSIVVTEKTDGTFDLTTLDYNIIPKSVVNGYSIVAGGGLVQRGETLYYSVYAVGTGNPSNSYLLKSEDYGKTFSLVGTIGVNSNENSVAFIGDTMYSVLRGVTVGTSWLSKSEDLGATWTVVKTFPTHWHGMFLHSMSDTIMVAGRSLAGAVRVMFFDKFGRSMLNDFYFSINGDSGYSQICTFENYVYLLYHTTFKEMPWLGGIQIQKIERNKLIGLSN